MTAQQREQRVELLTAVILEHLREHPAGMTEHDLLEALIEDHHSAIGAVDYSNRLQLFQVHFFLFHCLYRLQERLRERQEAELSIHCLRIQLHPFNSAEAGSALQQPDPLRAYYLDLDELETTSGEDVDALFDAFWRRYASHSHYQEALSTLGLTPPVDYQMVKSRYRELVMEHHPDRGGDTEKLQAITEAMNHLKLYYQ